MTQTAAAWRVLNLCVKLARAHPDWTVDKVELRATLLTVMGCSDEDECAERLRLSGREGAK